MIEAKLRVKVGSFRLEAELETGGLTCIAGRNGSGKSTLIRAIAGFVEVDQGGYVKVDGVDITRSAVEKRGVVMVTPDSYLPHLEVDSHLTWGARLRKLKPSSDRVSDVKAKLGIDFQGPVRRLSLGMRERVALATALISSPRAILVDEAFSNLHDRIEFIASYRELSAEAGIDVIFSSQDESDGAFSDHLYSIAEGRTSKLR